jgi:hypothetical protein
MLTYALAYADTTFMMNKGLIILEPMLKVAMWFKIFRYFGTMR